MKHLDDALAKVGLTREDVRFLIAVDGDERFAPVVMLDHGPDMPAINALIWHGVTVLK